MELPAWLRAMEHGALGEARVRAFLLERFWVLQHSVDVDGTDYLIQVRPRSLARFLDAPVQVGRIQAKFVGDDDTRVYVPRHYVVDTADKPYPLFFLLLTTGEAEGEQLYVLGASEIAVTSRSARETGRANSRSRPAGSFKQSNTRSRRGG